MAGHDAAGAGGAQRDLAFLVPAGPGRRVGAVGAAAALVEELAAAGADVRVVDAARGGRPGTPGGPATLSFASASLDGLVVPEARTDPCALVAEAGRVLRPGGALVLGVHHGHSVQRLREAGRRAPATAPPALSLRGTRRLLEHGGFTDVEAYGALESLRSPRFLVSLGAPPASRHFFLGVFQPHSRAAALAMLALPLLDRLRMHRMLFPGLVFTARRRPQGGDEGA